MKATLSILILFSVLSSAVIAQDSLDISLRKEAEHSIDFALKWLESTQEEDGSWAHYPAITALNVSAFLQSPQGYNEHNNLAVGKAIDFILGCQQADGGIYIDDLAGYNTAICLMALVHANNPKYADAIRKAREFLLSLQFDEADGVTTSDLRFGGIGYKEKERPDLSNLQWAIEALKESERYRTVSESSGKEQEGSGSKTTVTGGAAQKEVFWENAITFIQRCQNLRASNDQDSVGDDGGFIYSPSESKAGGHTSYGSMTYAGMKSFIYAGVQKDDRRVKAAFEWISKNYKVEENPEMGLQGLFYYYQTMAKALSLYGANVIVDVNGKKHNWKKELIEHLVKIQDGKGFWVNSNNRWWENKPELVTSYAVLALEFALR